GGMVIPICGWLLTVMGTETGSVLPCTNGMLVATFSAGRFNVPVSTTGTGGGVGGWGGGGGCGAGPGSGMTAPANFFRSTLRVAASMPLGASLSEPYQSGESSA